MALPKLSVRLHGGMTAQACLELARAADDVGFSTLWFAENLFGRGILPVMGACAAVTNRIGLGVGVFNPFNRHPTLIAMEIAALDELSGGRAHLALGAGVKGLLKQAGIDHSEPLAGMRDAVNIIRGLLAGDAVQYQGKVFSAYDVKLSIPSIRKGLPIYMAAQGDRALQLAGELADGVLLSNMSPPGYTVRARTLLAAGAQRAGHSSSREVLQYISCVARADRVAARQAAAEAVAEFLVRYWNMRERAPSIVEAMTRDSGIPEADFAAAVERLQGGTPAHLALDDRFIDTYAIAGNADDCLASVQRFAEIGVTELVLTFTGSQAEADLRYFGAARQSLGSPRF